MDMDRILRYLVLLGIFLLPLLALFVTNSLFFPFIVGKNFAFRIIVEVILVAWLILLARGAIARPKLSWLLVSVAAVTIVSTLACIFGEVPYRSFWSNFERMDGLITILHLSAYFIIAATTLAEERLWDRWFHTSLGVATLVSMVGVVNIIKHSGARVDATFGNATYLAVYMLFHVFIALYYMFRRDNLWTKLPYLVLAVFFTFILYHTATRGDILGLIGGLLVTLVLSVFSLSGKARKYAGIALCALILLVPVFFLTRQSEFVTKSPVLSRFANISFNESTTKSRLIIWGMSLKAVADHPVLGWGQENFNIAFNKYFDPRLYPQETWFDRAHNVVFDWLVATGILGLVAYLSLFASALYILFSRTKTTLAPIERNLLIGLLAGYFFQNLFVFDNIMSYLLFFSVLAYIHYRSEESPWLLSKFGPATSRAAAESGLKPYSHIIASLLVVALAFSLYFVNIKPIMANRLMIEGFFPHQLTEEKLVKIEKIFALNTFGSMEAREQFLFLLTDVSGQGLDQGLFARALDLGYKQMITQLLTTASDARHQLFMASFVHTFGKIEDARKLYENARILSPKKQLILFSLARVYRDLGDHQKSLEYAKESYELERTYEKALIEYVVAAIYAGQNELASQLLREHYQTDLVANPNIIKAYADTNQLSKVVDIWEGEIARDPKNPQAYVSLAASYYAQGMDAEAIAAIRRLIIADPGQKQRGEELIGQIRRGELPRK